jgi:hypothetical protein
LFMVCLIKKKSLPVVSPLIVYVFHKTPPAYRSGNKIRQEKMMVMMSVALLHFVVKINGQNRIPKI